MTTSYFNWFQLRASGEDLEHQDLVTLNDIECHYNNCKAVWYGLQEIEREVPRVYFALKPGYQVLRRASCSSVEACGLPRGHFEEEDEEPGWVFAHVPIRGSRAIQLPNLLAAAYYLKRDPLLQGYLLEDQRGFYIDRAVFESTFFKLFRDCPFLSPFPEHRPIYCGYIISRCEKQSPQVKAYYTLRFGGFGFDLCDQCSTQTSEDTQLDVVRITDDHRLGVELQPAFCRFCYIACTLVRSGYDCEHCSLKLLLNFSTETPSDDFAQSQHCNTDDGPYKTETRVLQILSAAERKSDPISPFSKVPSKHMGSP
ncbi:hypothetical protein QAD02_005161 [Eretmocerus hayati]|uniref:Uncharacterized protein n=1 Tax=Eretmocerus hayati TaxID=131215 RepID=A0ACC2NRL8_9HYME|nr:hypothetical protein QAD02_005161 [Eretmocerus hayati]